MTVTEKMQIGFFGGILVIGLPAIMIGTLLLFG
jgi:hypothetical protein